MRRKLLLAAMISSLIGFAVLRLTGLDRSDSGDAPQHTNARVAWWKAPNQIGGTVNLTVPDSPIPGIQIRPESCTFENDQNSAVLSWRFLRNDGDNDIYEFTVRTNQQRELARTVSFDGVRAVVAVDEPSGTSTTIESKDPFERS